MTDDDTRGYAIAAGALLGLFLLLALAMYGAIRLAERWMQ